MNSEEVISNLYELYRENKFSHAYLIETNNVLLCLSDIKRLIKMTICSEEYEENCEKCNLCSLLDKGYLPSVLVIEPNGKTINKESIDELKEKFSYNSLYTKNNYYIIVEAEKMNDTAYNKLLKFLEEPEDNIIGFYICSNIQKMPPTILSRLEQVKIYYKEESIVNEEMLKLAHEYLDLLIKDNKKGIWYNNNELCNYISERVDYIEFFKYLLKYAFEKNDIQLTELIRRYLEKLEYNVNITMLLDNFVIEVGELYGL